MNSEIPSTWISLTNFATYVCFYFKFFLWRQFPSSQSPSFHCLLAFIIWAIPYIFQILVVGLSYGTQRSPLPFFIWQPVTYRRTVVMTLNMFYTWPHRWYFKEVAITGRRRAEVKGIALDLMVLCNLAATRAEAVGKEERWHCQARTQTYHPWSVPLHPVLPGFSPVTFTGRVRGSKSLKKRITNAPGAWEMD